MIKADIVDRIASEAGISKVQNCGASAYSR